MASTTLNTNNIVNFVLFQLVWLGFVLGSTKGYIWVGATLLVAMLVWQLWPSRRNENDFLIIGASATCGFIVATIWSFFGLIEYAEHWPAKNIAPWWIIAMWVAFGASFNHSLGWIQKSPYLAGVLAGIGGPVSYFGAARIGAVVINQPWLTFSLMAVAWFAIAFFLTILVQRQAQAEKSWTADVRY
ncbi:DUF2878 domain-containing protein [Kangiella marina]|uniref:DUF2878 domain-containing protein n=1 Tax=Kangiella marina TaxID=1079178 RepID=A0ABP8IHX4_9GAMM